jgi:glutamate formiminotransferase
LECEVEIYEEKKRYDMINKLVSEYKEKPQIKELTSKYDVTCKQVITTIVDAVTQVQNISATN